MKEELKRCNNCKSGNIIGGTKKCKECKREPLLIDNWELREIPLKVTEKLFKIKYIQPQAYDPDWLNPMRLKGFLDGYTKNECNITVEEFNPRAWEITKIPEKSEIDKGCDNCGWDYKGNCQEDSDEPCRGNSLWKPIEKNKWKGIE